MRAMLATAMVYALVVAPPVCAAPAVAVPAGRAADIVRGFEGRPGMQVPAPVVFADVQGRPVYSFEFDGTHRVWVDAQTGAVVRASFPGPHRAPNKDERLSEDDATRIARAFAEAHYPEFLRRPITVSCTPGDQPLVAFRQRVPANGAVTANYLAIDIDGASHAVSSVFFHDAPVSPGLAAAPGVSAAEAADIAGRWMGARILAVPHSQLAPAPRFGREQVWGLRLLCAPGDGLVYLRWATVDAQSGELLDIATPRGDDAESAADNTCVLHEPLKQREGILLSLKPRVAGDHVFIPTRFAELLGLKRQGGPEGQITFRAPGGAADVPVTTIEGQPCVCAADVFKAARADDRKALGSFHEDVRRGALLVEVRDGSIINRAIAWGIGTRLKPTALDPKMGPWHVPYVARPPR